MKVLVVLLTLSAVHCAANKEFVDDSIVWRVADDRPIDKPEVRKYLANKYFADVLVFRRVTRALALRGHRPAMNTNALDEVPDSSWFTNRIGLYEFSATEVARGGTTAPGPRPPLVITSGKLGSGKPGFAAKDATGRSFVIKFDPPENPEIQTATNAVVNRLLWAAGYNVPSDYVFHFKPADVSVEHGAMVEGKFGKKELLTLDAVHDMLSLVVPTADGRIRATASESLKGVPVGGFSNLGTRPDDPNDVIEHEHRRELRGLRALAAWLGHTDMKEDNTLDMYVGAPGKGYLVHYFIDFDKALGARQVETQRWEDGWEHVWDWERNTLNVVTLGLWKRPWEDTKLTVWPSIGAFSADPFSPEHWREAYPYFPFIEARAPDLFWGAKIVMRFRREHIAAAVGAGQFSDPDAAAYLVETLVRRRDMIGREWLDGVTPIDYFGFRDGQLCGTDLVVRYGLAPAGVVEVLKGRGNKVQTRIPVGRYGEVCIDAPKHARYTVLRLRTVRDGKRRPPMQVHLRGGPKPRVLGVIRTEEWE